MHKRFMLIIPVALAAILPAFWFGCATAGRDRSDDGNGGSPPSSSGGFGGGSGQDADCESPSGPIVISPTDVTLRVVSGQPMPTQAFTASVNGTDITPTVVWSFERPEMGDVLSGSTFTPTGKIGGVSKLIAQVCKARATTTITVFVNKIVTGLTEPQRAQLDKPTGGPDLGAQLVYPYADTVFPLGVLAPDLQWNGADAADLYKLQIQEKYFDYVEYFNAPPPRIAC
jgi:hypothetical protein